MKPKSPSRSRKREPELFLNRELSWLAFNTRVLEEAADATVALLDRLRFATIVAGNLDEFFMVRVAALKNAVEESDASADLAGLTPNQQLQQISERAHEMVERLYKALNQEILPALAQRGIRIAPLDALDGAQRAALSRHFRDEVLPALTPLAIDSSRPFPMLSSLSLNLALLLAPSEGEEPPPGQEPPRGEEPPPGQEPPRGEEPPRLAVVQVPGRLPRLVRPAGADGTTYALLEDVIRSELPALFPGQKLLESAAFRIARDAELDLDDEGGRDLLQVVEEELRGRRRSRVVRLEVEAAASEALREVLARSLDVGSEDVYRIPGPLDVRAFQALVDLPALEDLREPPPRPMAILDTRELEDPFAVLDQRDVLLHHPYDSFDPVTAFVSRAAEDPDVLAIKQTLYRPGRDSPVVQALARAAEQGKQVTVVVELTARFDEQSNIRWARSLEEAGAHVIYGIRGLKTHAKIALVVRRGRQGIRRYAHLGTGNYNHQTARAYTDFGLMTADAVIGEDASSFFNALTGYSDPPRMKKLVMAPTALRERFVRLVERERRRAEEGQAAEIRAKMNALVDEDIIRALYEASRAGVRIRLNVRGICCLRPGVKGLSETIDVVSVVDRFLEHSRIYYFRNGGDEEVYLSSADWMPRNLDRRIELLFPIEASECRLKVLQALDAMFLDNVKGRWLLPDGTYKRKRATKGEEPFRAQLHIHREALKALERARGALAVTLEPVTGPGARST